MRKNKPHRCSIFQKEPGRQGSVSTVECSRIPATSVSVDRMIDTCFSVVRELPCGTASAVTCPVPPAVAQRATGVPFRGRKKGASEPQGKVDRVSSC